ncbi:alpha/beta hydrolase [Catellatospora sp. KI3]|uniref:alpha/beta hydrolase n=1 Tax=Catellatospora sp. KI3 TaxID=3041620 RepID=UPI002482181A|nr:alpha/beta hydrolase [Catellatospora sp. KI3]MDI1466137.1 alpha/beta hydrolase [Catellatospora sp. KI3]
MAAVVRVAVIVLLVLALLLGAVWALQRRLIYLPDRASPGPAGRTLPGARDVELTTSDGLRLTAWLVPPTGPDRDIAVLYAPGNGGNRAGRAPLAAALAAQGLTVLLLDYRGYGGNPGSPDEEKLARDARAARAHLVTVEGADPQRLIYFGESLGCAVATEMAVELPPGGLLLRSPFTDLAATAAEHYPFLPVRLLLRDRFPVAEQIAQVSVPTAVVYGSRDTVVPTRQSELVAARAGGTVEVTVVAGADHNDPDLFDGPQVVAAVTRLADRIDHATR